MGGADHADDIASDIKHEDSSLQSNSDKGKGPEVINVAPKDDKDKKKDDKEEPKPMVPFSSMFRYATALDKTLMAFGTIGAIGNGAGMQ